MRSIAGVAADLAAGRVSSRELLEQALARIADPSGEGSRVFTRVHAASARAAADAADASRKAGVRLSPLAGVPVSVKDLFDLAGETTTAGSRVLRQHPAAPADALAVQRLRAAGAVIVGSTNMTEFAYSGLGINPHYGTPQNPWARSAADPLQGRIPGGSSSGAAVSVADGMAVMGLGTDTGGSVRIPAALCGLTGFKPTTGRISTQGALPLSFTLDSIGPLAATVACCAVSDRILAGLAPDVPEALPLQGLRLGVLRGYVQDGLDDAVGTAFGHALSTLSAAGAQLRDVSFDELKNIPTYTAKGHFSAPECYQWHRQLLQDRQSEYDPRIAGRILKGRDVMAWEYAELIHLRQRAMQDAARAFAPFDAWLLPSVPLIAPRIAELDASDEAYGKVNLAMLRNTSLFNFLDGCGLSLPCHKAGEAPVGLMVMAMGGHDDRMLALGQGIESALRAAGCAVAV